MIIRPESNKPLTVNLLYPSAKEKSGRNGIDFMYTLQGGDALFVPPIAHEEIQKLHAGRGEPFTILKSTGQGNQAVWKVERILTGDPAPPQVSGRPATPSSNPPREDLAGRHARVEHDYVAPKHITNGNGVKGKPVEIVPAAGVSTAQSRTLLRQLVAAIEACIAAKAYAKSVGVALDFDGHDIRALAISGSIQVFKEGVY